MRLVKVMIVYKSGAMVKLRCKSFTVSRDMIDGSVSEMKWDDARPRPLMAGPEQIAAVWSTKPRWLRWWQR